MSMLLIRNDERLLGRYRRPAVARVETGDGRRLLRGVRSEILLVHDAVVVDDERHHAGARVPRRIRDGRESADHVALHHVVERAALGVRALATQGVEVIAVIRLRPFALGIAFTGRAGYQRAERARALALRGLPVQAVLLAWRAGELPRVFAHAILVAIGGGVLLLRVD